MKKRLLLIIAFVAVMISCSKDDGDGNTGENPTGGEIFTSQAVKIQIPEGTELSQPMYDGTIGGIPVKLVKAPGNILVFYLPSNSITGSAELVIPGLSNMTIEYNIQQTVLNGSPETVMGVYFNKLASLEQNLGDSPQEGSLRHNIENLEQIYAAANAEEKTEMALAYQANKVAFDAILSITMDRATDREASDAVLKIGLATAAIVEGVALVAAVTVTGATTAALLPAALGAVTVYAGLVLINNTIDDIFEVNIIKDKLNLGGLFGINGRSETPRFLSNVPRTISFKADQREITQSDSARTDEHTADFFEHFGDYSNYVGITNNSIGMINTQLDNADLHTMASTQLSSNNSFDTLNVDEETFSNISFTVSHPNVTLEESSLIADGQIKLKFKINGTPSSVPVEAFLNYTFDNGFSSFTGKFPIIVDISLEGTWKMTPTLGGGACDEILIIDEMGGPLNLTFNEDNTITFLTDPSGAGLNGAAFSQTYDLNGNLTINVSSDDGIFTADLTYNAATNTFSGTYSNTWSDGVICTNTVTLTKIN